MVERILKRWSHAPWHSWLRDEPAWLELIANLWARMPRSAVFRLLNTARPLVILPPVEMGRVVRITTPLPAGANILMLDARLLDRSAAEALGILAHELAHACVYGDAECDELANDLEADRLALSWGFRAELVTALERDLDPAHPRLAAARAA